MSRALPIAGWLPMPPNNAVLEAPLRHVYKPLPHDSGAKHVQGAAEYIDDIAEPTGTLHIAVGGAPVARGTIRRIDLSEVQNAPGVVAVITAAHIPGKNDISPATRRRTGVRPRPHRFPQSAGVRGHCPHARRGAPRGVARQDRGRRRAAERLRRAGQGGRRARAAGLRLYQRRCRQDDRRGAVSLRPEQFRIGGQEHFYLEGQVALAVPGEDGAVLVYSSTQHPSEVQHIVARVLALPDCS